MSLTTWETVITGLNAAVLIGTVAGSIRLLRRRPRSLTVFYFHFAIISDLTAMLYWLAFDLLLIQTRMPFAANEFAEAAAFLMLAASLNAAEGGSFRDARTEVALAAVFGVCNAALWVTWNGEWAEFIMGGAAFTYFLCVCARCLKHSGALNRCQWIVLGAGSLVVLLLQLGWIAWAPAHPVMDHIATAPAVAMVLLWIIRLVRAIRRGESWRRRFILAVCAFAWCTTVMYMTTGWWYLAAELLNIIITPLMLLQLEREAEP